MAGWNKIITGRSSMGRARPLILAMNALRRREEEMDRRLGVIPGRGRGVGPIFRSEWKGFWGGKMLVFLWEGVGDSQHLYK